MIDVKIFVCEDNNCHRQISYNTHTVYLPIYNASSWEPIFFDNISDINVLIERLLDQLPKPQDLTANDFQVNKVLVFHSDPLLLNVSSLIENA